MCESKLNTKLHVKRYLFSPEQIFAALVVELSLWITNGRSYNGDQNVTAETKIAKAIYFMAHGGDGFTLGVALSSRKCRAQVPS